MAMSSHWSVDDLIKELHDIGALFQTRPESKFLDQLKLQFLQKLEGVDRMSAGNIIQLTKVLESSPLPADWKQQVQDAIDITAMRQQAGPLKLGTAPQSMEHVWNYMSKSEGKAMQTLCTTDAVTSICMRLRAIGLRSMKETTKKNIVAFLVYLQLQQGKPMPPVQDLYNLSKYVHESFLACTQMAVVPGFAKYPSNPRDLGEDTGQQSVIELLTVHGGIVVMTMGTVNVWLWC